MALKLKHTYVTINESTDMEVEGNKNGISIWVVRNGTYVLDRALVIINKRTGKLKLVR